MSTMWRISQYTSPVSGSSELMSRGCQAMSCRVPPASMMIGWL